MIDSPLTTYNAIEVGGGDSRGHDGENKKKLGSIFLFTWKRDTYWCISLKSLLSVWERRLWEGEVFLGSLDKKTQF